jgi:hypothetical protein
VESLAGLTPAPDNWTDEWTHSVESGAETEGFPPQVLDNKRVRP